MISVTEGDGPGKAWARGGRLAERRGSPGVLRLAPWWRLACGRGILIPRTGYGRGLQRVVAFEDHIPSVRHPSRVVQMVWCGLIHHRPGRVARICTDCEI